MKPKELKQKKKVALTSMILTYSPYLKISLTKLVADQKILKKSRPIRWDISLTRNLNL